MCGEFQLTLMMSALLFFAKKNYLFFRRCNHDSCIIHGRFASAHIHQTKNGAKERHFFFDHFGSFFWRENRRPSGGSFCEIKDNASWAHFAPSKQ